jgi:hypothetical protein
MANRGYDADWFRAALIAKGITPCIPPKKERKGSDRIRQNTLQTKA